MENPTPSSAQKYKNAQGIEIDDYSNKKKWGLRLGFYAVYYLFIYLLYLYSISYITGKTHAPGMKAPITQGRLGSPRMTLFPLDQIREIDWIARSGVDNHLWYKDVLNYDGGISMKEAYKNLLSSKLENMRDSNFSSAVTEFCDGDYINFENGKACFLVGVNTVVNWQPVKLNLNYTNNWFNVKLSPEKNDADLGWFESAPEVERTQFSLESQGLNETDEADIYFQCRVFETRFDEDADICRPLSETAGFIMNSGIEWMNGENYLKNFQPFQGGVNPKGDEKYDECFQPSFYPADCNINEYDYQSWSKPMTAVKIDINQVNATFQAQNGPSEEAQQGYEFKCNAYAQNIIAPIYVEAEKVYYEGDNEKPIVQSGGRDLHQNFIIQF